MTGEPEEPTASVIPFAGHQREARTVSGITRKDYDEAMAKQEDEKATLSNKVGGLIIKLEVAARYLGHATPQGAGIVRHTVADFAFRQLYVDACVLLDEAATLRWNLREAKRKARKFRKKWKAAK